MAVDGEDSLRSDRDAFALWVYCDAANRKAACLSDEAVEVRA
jgi:hypothetical protein